MNSIDFECLIVELYTESTIVDKEGLHMELPKIHEGEYRFTA